LYTSSVEFDGDEESSDAEEEEAEDDDDISQAVTKSPLHSPKRVTAPSVNTAANGTAVVSTKTSDSFDVAPEAAVVAVDSTLSDKITTDSSSNSNTQQGQGQGQGQANIPQADDSQKAGGRGDRSKTIRFEGSNPMRDAGEHAML
jgi:hypothetical protein